MFVNIIVTILVNFLLSNQTFAAIDCGGLLNSLVFNGYAHTKIIADNELLLSKNWFGISRPLEGPKSYQAYFNSNKIPTLRSYISDVASINGKWMDVGAGLAIPMRSLLKEKSFFKRNIFKDVDMYAVGFKKPDINGLQNENEIKSLNDDLKIFSDNIKYLETGYIEESIEREDSEIFKLRGKVDLITEVWGPIHYTGSLQSILNTYADLLKVGGIALIHFEEYHTQILINGKRVFLRDLEELFPILTGGRLKVKTTGMNHSSTNSPQISTSFFEIIKVNDFSQDPLPVLKTFTLTAGTPPERKIEFVDLELLQSKLSNSGIKIKIDRKLEYQEEGYPYNREELPEGLIEKTDDLLNK